MSRLVPCLLALAAAGCVSQKQYLALETELQSTQAELEERNASLAEQQKQQSRGKAQVESLQLALRNEKEKAQEQELRILALHKEMAAALKDKARLKASVDDLAAALAESYKRKEEADSRVREFKQLLERLRGLMNAGKLKVRVVDGRVVVVLPSDILFASGAAELSPEGQSSIASVASALAGLPKRRFQVEGHTDSVPIRTRQFPSNWELASARAIHVVRAMISAGMPPTRVSAASFGATRPVSPNSSAEGRALNRRIDITLVPDLGTLPGMEELKRSAPGGAQDTLAAPDEEVPEQPAAPAGDEPAADEG